MEEMEFIVESYDKIRKMTVDDLRYRISRIRGNSDQGKHITIIPKSEIFESTDFDFIKGKLPLKVFKITPNGDLDSIYTLLDKNDLTTFCRVEIQPSIEHFDDMKFMFVNPLKTKSLEEMCDKWLWREILEGNTNPDRIIFNREKAKFVIGDIS